MGLDNHVLDDCVLHQGLLGHRVINCRYCSVLSRSFIFQFPSVFPLVMDQFGMVVSLVEVFQNSRKHFGLFVGQIDPSGMIVQELASARSLEEGRSREDVFVTGKETLFGTDADCHNGRSQSARKSE